MLISDCIFASLIVIEFFLSEFKYHREREREKGEEGVLLIMRGDC